VSTYLHTIISFCPGARVRQTDRQTDGRTDGQTAVDSKTVRTLRSRTVKTVRRSAIVFRTRITHFNWFRRVR